MAALSNIRVLDLTRVVAGPLTTQVLADLGAEVIKIEKPGEGDDTRRMGPFLKDAAGRDTNDSAFYLACNRNKKSVTLDISTASGQAIARDLAAQCDVFIENYKSGALARYGLDYPRVSELNPRVVYCSVTGFGADGPYAGRPAYDFILQGMSGLMSTCGQPEGAPGGAPMRAAVPITDMVTGLYAAISVLAALRQRDETGRGQYIDAAMIDASVAMNGHLAIGYLMTGQVPGRIGNANPIAAPSETYATSDSRIIVAAGNNNQFAALAKALGRPDLLEDPRFASNPERVRNRAALAERLGAHFLADTGKNWVERLSAAGVPCGPINDMAAVFADPQVRQRGIQLSAPHGRGIESPMLKSPLNMSDSPVEYRAAPMLGADTDQILRERLGMSAAQIAQLRAENTI